MIEIWWAESELLSQSVRLSAISMHLWDIGKRDGVGEHLQWPPRAPPSTDIIGHQLQIRHRQCLRMLLWNSLMLVHAHKQDFYTECIRQHKIQIISFPWALPWIHKIAAWLFFAINPDMSFLRFHSPAKFKARLILICHLDPATRVGLTEKVGSAVKTLSALADATMRPQRSCDGPQGPRWSGHCTNEQQYTSVNTRIMPLPLPN